MIRHALVSAFVTITAAAGSSAQAAPAPDASLTAADVATFCGSPGHETSASYSKAVLADVKRRESAGAKNAGEALAAMRLEYCKSQGVK